MACSAMKAVGLVSGSWTFLLWLPEIHHSDDGGAGGGSPRGGSPHHVTSGRSHDDSRDLRDSTTVER